MTLQEGDEAEWGNEAGPLGPWAFVCGDRSGDRFCCYVLESRTGRGRYVGMTCDPHRRIRQHNRELRGGAKATARGGPWGFAAVLQGFADLHEALTAEWRLKRLGRGGRGAGGVLRGLAGMLERRAQEGFLSWTSTSRYDVRSSGLALHLSSEAAGAAPELRRAAEAVGWAVREFEGGGAPDLLEAGLLAGLYRQALPRVEGAAAVRARRGSGRRSGRGAARRRA